MVRLSFDQEAWTRGWVNMPLSEAERAAIDAHLRERLVELVSQEVDVVLDFSFWSRHMRDDWRALLAPHGVIPETIYVQTARETCLARVASRRGEYGDDFALEPDVAAAYFDHFEPPTPDEGPLTCVPGAR